MPNTVRRLGSARAINIASTGLKVPVRLHNRKGTDPPAGGHIQLASQCDHEGVTNPACRCQLSAPSVRLAAVTGLVVARLRSQPGQAALVGALSGMLALTAVLAVSYA